MNLHYNLDKNELFDPSNNNIRLNYTPQFFILKKTSVSVCFYTTVEGVLTPLSINGGKKTFSVDIDFDNATTPMFQIENTTAATDTTHTVEGVLTSDRAIDVIGAEGQKNATAEFKIFNPTTTTQIDHVAQFKCIVRNLVNRGGIA